VAHHSSHPNAGGSELLDHFVGSKKHRFGYRQADLPGYLEIDDEFELRGLLHREFSWIGAIEELGDVLG
jgi:hypothetical protein